MTWPTHQGVFPLGDLSLQSGATLPDARLSWKAHGTLSAARDNVILYPTSYGAQHPDLEWLIGPDGVLDPTRYFIVIADMFGNGLSSSPSIAADYPPLVTVFDNVHAQRRLLCEQFGIEHLVCVYGWSMGALQAYHWAALFPGTVARAVINCGVARTAVHNQVFLRGLMAVLEAAAEHRGDGRFAAEPVAAKRAFGRIYAGWALSQTFYRREMWRGLGFTSLEDFLVRSWEANFLRRDRRDLLAQLLTWQMGDISANELFRGDLEMALSAIKAKVLLMPSATDLYFQTDDNRAELPHLKGGKLAEIPSVWGHRAGNPRGIPEETAFINAEVTALLES